MGRTRFLDLTGRKFGKLTALAAAGQNKAKQYLWECRCECGQTSIVIGSNLIRGNTKACGCVRLREIADRTRTHNKSKTRIYKIWVGVRKRCNIPSTKSFNHYGGRGIKVCERWNHFENFYEDMIEGYRDNLSLERKDPDGNYEPSNCRWATAKEQARNKRNTRLVECDGVFKTLAEWEEISGTGRSTIAWRIKNDWPIREAIYGEPVKELNEIKQYLVF